MQAALTKAATRCSAAQDSGCAVDAPARLAMQFFVAKCKVHHSYAGRSGAGLRVDDVGRAGAVVADMRKIIRQDPRIIQKLHRRVFIDKLTREQVRCGRRHMPFLRVRAHMMRPHSADMCSANCTRTR